jgi:hypothetical protein
MTPNGSELGITKRLDGISERKSSDFSGMFSPMSPNSMEGQVIDSSKLKEIKHYVSHELYKCQKKTDQLFKSLEQL